MVGAGQVKDRPLPHKNVNFLTNAVLFLAMWQAPANAGPSKIWFDGRGPSHTLPAQQRGYLNNAFRNVRHSGRIMLSLPFCFVGRLNLLNAVEALCAAPTTNTRDYVSRQLCIVYALHVLQKQSANEMEQTLRSLTS